MVAVGTYRLLVRDGSDGGTPSLADFELSEHLVQTGGERDLGNLSERGQ